VETFKDYFENAGIALLIIDAKGTILHANKEFEKLSKIKQEQIIDKLAIYDFIAHDDRNDIKELLKTKFEAVSLPHSLLSTFVSSKREQISMMLNFNYLQDKDQLICAFIDTIPVRRAENAVQQEKFQKEIAEIASGIAHEIRNPLSAINTSIEILRDSLLVTGEDEDLMNIILEENKRLDQIIKEFSYYAKLNSPDISLTDINELIEEAVSFQQQNAPADISIVTKLLASPPPMYIDRPQIKSVFFNIMDNALESMPDGGILEIVTSLEKNEFNDDVLAIRFKDSGCGIRPEDMDNIFKPFFTDKENHSGMGLSISKRILEKHNGEIHIDSKPSQGTSVTIILPILYQKIIAEQTPGLI